MQEHYYPIEYLERERHDELLCVVKELEEGYKYDFDKLWEMDS